MNLDLEMSSLLESDFFSFFPKYHRAIEYPQVFFNVFLENVLKMRTYVIIKSLKRIVLD